MVMDTRRYLMSEMNGNGTYFVSSGLAGEVYEKVRGVQQHQKVMIDSFLYTFNMRTRTPIPAALTAHDHWYAFLWVEFNGGNLPSVVHVMFVRKENAPVDSIYSKDRYHYCLTVNEYLLGPEQYMGKQWDAAIEEHKMREYAIKNGYTHTFALKPDHEIRKVVEQVLTEKGLIK